MTKRSKARARGVTHFEAKLGIVAIALLGSGAAYAYGQAHADARDQKSAEAAAEVLQAAERYFEESGSGCPTLTSLRRDEYLGNDDAASDAWGGRFRISCDQEGLSVYSAGPDGKLGSTDDVQAGRPRS